MKRFTDNLMNSLFIVGVFSFTTMGVSKLTDNIYIQLLIYLAIITTTAIYDSEEEEC